MSVKIINVAFDHREHALMMRDKRAGESWHDYLLRKLVGDEWAEMV